MRNSLFHHKSLVESENIGKKTRVWAFAHVMEHAYIGEDCNIGDHCFIEDNVRVGNRVTVKNGVSLWDGIIIEDNVFVGPNAVFTNDLLPISRIQKRPFEKTLVKKGACIGANATILCGITIGRYAFIGAGSLVTSDVSDYCLVYGNPAKPKGHLCACRKKLKFVGQKAFCRCGLCYQKISNKVRAA